MGLWNMAGALQGGGAAEEAAFKLEPDETALLIIDVQQGLFNRSQPIYHADELIRKLNLLADRFRSAGAPVVFIQHANDKMLLKGTPDWELHPGLERFEGDVLIEKTHGNAFEETNLGEEMNKLGILNLVITGLVTHGCVRATCEGGYVLGYRVILVEDGHSNYHKRAAELIQEWNRKLAEGWVELCPAADIRF